MKTPDVSIIVPVYNAEKYLSRCIDSILAQTLHNFELLLVDDGSTDSSGKICDDYAAKDARISVIHQKNAGVSAARNAGLDAAKGKYIGFVDADDRVSTDMFEALYKAATDGDYPVVMCDAMTVYPDGKEEVDTITQLTESKVLDKSDIVPELLLELAGSACRCIYNYGLIMRYRITFPIGVKFSEDRVFNILCLGSAEKIRYIKKPYYYRYINTESTVHRFHADYFEACLTAETAIEQAIETAWGGRDEYRIAYLRTLVTGAIGAICNYYYRTSTMSKNEKRTAIMNVCQNEVLREAIQRSGNNGICQRWIMSKRVGMLAMYARLANLKHGR